MRAADEVILQVEELTTRFHLKRGTLTAVDRVSFAIRRGETFGLVGESGCGKSVTARSLMRLIPIPPGEIATGRIVFEGEELLRLVGIPSAERRMDNYVHQFSGGMRQRVMLAMALSCDPQFLIADEPTTALDVTIQAQILDLIRQMINRFEMSLLFITHNLGVVAHMCDTVGVMYASHVVELTDTKTLFAKPLHPYTWGFLTPIPNVENRTRYLNPIQGTVCNMVAPPTGCNFHPRCEKAMDICRREAPPLREVAPGHKVACHL